MAFSISNTLAHAPLHEYVHYDIMWLYFELLQPYGLECVIAFLCEPVQTIQVIGSTPATSFRTHTSRLHDAQ